MKMIVMIMLVKFETNLKLYTEVIRYLLQVYTYLGKNQYTALTTILNT